MSTSSNRMQPDIGGYMSASMIEVWRLQGPRVGQWGSGIVSKALQQVTGLKLTAEPTTSQAIQMFCKGLADCYMSSDFGINLASKLPHPSVP